MNMLFCPQDTVVSFLANTSRAQTNLLALLEFLQPLPLTTPQKEIITYSFCHFPI